MLKYMKFGLATLTIVIVGVVSVVKFAMLLCFFVCDSFLPSNFRYPSQYFSLSFAPLPFHFRLHFCAILRAGFPAALSVAAPTTTATATATIIKQVGNTDNVVACSY